MVAHLGGDATLPQSLLIQQAARLQLATDLAWSGVLEDDLKVDSPAFNNYMRASRGLRDTLVLLGLERKAKDISLESYLEEKGGLA
jgi:hypothetical protein